MASGCTRQNILHPSFKSSDGNAATQCSFPNTKCTLKWSDVVEMVLESECMAIARHGIDWKRVRYCVLSTPADES